MIFSSSFFSITYFSILSNCMFQYIKQVKEDLPWLTRKPGHRIPPTPMSGGGPPGGPPQIGPL